MKSFSRNLMVCILGCCIVLLSACSPASDRKQYIPADAIAVMTLNGSKLGKKIAWEVLFSGDLFKNFKSDDVKKTGIDLMDNFYVYALPDQRLGAKVKFVAIVPLTDQREWVVFLKSKYPGFHENSEKGFHTAPLQGNMIAGWNSKTAILVFTPNSYGLEENNTSAILSETLDATLHIDEKDAISGNEKFQLLQKDNFDIGIWVNYERLSQSLPQNSMGAAAAFTGHASLTRDVYMTGGINFEKGKISGDIKYYTNPAMLGIMKQMISENYTDDLAKRMPPGNAAVVLSYHINPQGIKSMLDTMDATTIINDELEDQGLTIDGILHCFTGDFFFSASDVARSVKVDTFNFNGHTDTFSRNETSANWMLAFKVADRQAMDKLLQTFINEKVLTGKDENLFSVEGTPALLAIRDGYAVLTAKEQNIGHFFSGPGAGRADIPAEISRNPMGVFFNMDALSPLFESRFSVFSPSGKMKNLPANIVLYGGAVKEDYTLMHVDINFQQKEENSLLQIIRAAGEASDAQRQNVLPNH